jgi:hypothetical protein
MQVNQIAFNGDVYCAVGENAYCATSTDQINWEDHHENFKKVFVIGGNGNGIAWNGEVFCAVGGGPLPYGAFACCGISKDGKNWTSSQLNLGMWIVAKSIEWDGKQFIVKGYHGETNTSTDGIEWKKAE